MGDSSDGLWGSCLPGPRDYRNILSNHFASGNFTKRLTKVVTKWMFTADKGKVRIWKMKSGVSLHCATGSSKQFTWTYSFSPSNSTVKWGIITIPTFRIKMLNPRASKYCVQTQDSGKGRSVPLYPCLAPQTTISLKRTMREGQDGDNPSPEPPCTGLTGPSGLFPGS